MTAPDAVARMVEALLFAAAEPLSEADLADRLPEGADAGAALAALALRWPPWRSGMRAAAWNWSRSAIAGASRPPPTWRT